MDKMNDADNMEIIVSELNKMGHLYFGHHKQPYRDIALEGGSVEAFTKGEFLTKYEEETGEPPEGDDDEASFSDAYRHAALIDVDTLTVPPGLWDKLTEGLKKTDYIFTWKMIQGLPVMLAGTRLVAIHVDTEGGEPEIFFPLPGSGSD